jgi:hypothetical protein
MQAILLLGVILIVPGAALFGYSHFFSHTTQQTILETWLLIAGGVCMIAFVTLSKKEEL